MVKKKNKRLLARVGSLIGVVLVLCCMVVPVSGATGSVPYMYSVLPLDGVRLTSGVSGTIDLPWVADFFLSNESPSEVSSDGFGYAVTDPVVSLANNNFTFDVAFSGPLSSFGSITFYSDSCVLRAADLRDSNFSVFFGYNGDASARVDISFLVARVTNTGTNYCVQTKRFTYGEYCSSGVNLLDLISEAITDGSYVPSDYVFISDLEIAFTDFSSDDQWLSFDIDWNTTRPDIFFWYRQFDLPITQNVIYEDGFESFSFDWLVVSVSGFLDVELWPNFSIGGLLSVVFMIGLVFLFIKFFS